MKTRGFYRAFFIVTAILSQPVWADTCPSIYALHQNQLAGWAAYDADNGTPLSDTALKRYELKVQSFGEATYYGGAPEGAAQCYYSGEEAGDYLNVYLAHQNLYPDMSADVWKKTFEDQFECRASIESCSFIPAPQDRTGK